MNDSNSRNCQLAVLRDKEVSLRKRIRKQKVIQAKHNKLDKLMIKLVDLQNQNENW